MKNALDLFPVSPEENPRAPKQTRGSFLTGDNEWYSPSVYVEAARATMGVIDLDPASNEHAQNTVKAGKFHSEADDGLAHKWYGCVWMNPPYGRGIMSKFIFKLVEEFKSGRVTQAVIVTHNYTDTKWAHAAYSVCSALCLTRGRIKFYNRDGVGEAPPHGQVFIYFGDNVKAFKENFEQFGYVVVPFNV
jgi:ParB family chromosome partitioning protein